MDTFIMRSNGSGLRFLMDLRVHSCITWSTPAVHFVRLLLRIVSTFRCLLFNLHWTAYQQLLDETEVSFYHKYSNGTFITVGKSIWIRDLIRFAWFHWVKIIPNWKTSSLLFSYISIMVHWSQKFKTGDFLISKKLHQILLWIANIRPFPSDWNHSRSAGMIRNGVLSNTTCCPQNDSRQQETSLTVGQGALSWEHCTVVQRPVYRWVPHHSGLYWGWLTCREAWRSETTPSLQLLLIGGVVDP